MLGWNIGIYRQIDDREMPGTSESRQGTRLAVWQTGPDGLGWLDELVKSGKAIDLGGDGYPFRYTAMAQYLIPEIIHEPPGANSRWICEPTDILSEKWEGKTVVDHVEADCCDHGEWLLVEAWDES
jgi:hypothetical protein